MKRVVLGIDEVGRGCWAGPLVAGAVILHTPLNDVRDSKKLTAIQRSKLAKLITSHGHIGLGWVTPKEVDDLGLTKAVGLAMQRAVQQITHDFSHIIIDGNINYFPQDSRAKAVIKADDTVAEVSAASIVAKVARDAYMAQMALDHPAYGFERHVGYGTKLHKEALQKYGPTVIHRMSYKPLRALL